jgi:lipopolysaccharide/colanic/teichoic acid biosynthesis glycosyltransferase
MLYRKYIKSFIDLFIAFIALIALSPIFILVFIILLFYNNGKPFFFHTRPGKDEKNFKMIKFKTMKDEVTIKGRVLSDLERITKFGDFLRKYSLDEIPQLINVIKGEMSIIGPRPLLVQYLKYYNTFQRQRHDIKPGITGWAQINGRNAIDWNKRFELDIWYVKNVSFALDIKILFLTIYKVLKKESVYNDHNTINEEFKGTNKL